MLSKSFKAGKCKTSLKLAVARIKLLKNKRQVQVKQMKRDLAQLLEAGQDQTARIRVEHVIREEKTMSAYDLIELYCELIVARLAIIESQKSCPIDLKEAISSVIFASPRCADIPELLDVRKQFAAKYGKEFAASALELRPDSGVNRMIVEKLSAKAPDIETKIKVLTAIAQEHSIKWDPKAFEEQVQKPSEDLLSGPSSFTNKTAVESSTIQFPPSPGENKAATKPIERDVDRSSFGSNFFPPTLAETASRHGPSAAASTYNGGEPGDSYFREEVPSLNQQKWTMEFKDATSAAQAAAEAAERASMAARAAAELASRGNDPEYSYRSNESSVYGSKQRMQSGLEAGVQDHVARDPKRVNEDSETTRSQYSRIVSSPSVGSSSAKDAIEANHQRKKIGKDDSAGEETAERYSIRRVSSYSSNHSHDEDSFVSNLQKSDSDTSESFFKADSINRNLSDRTNVADAGQRVERKSSKSLSSRSSVGSIDHAVIRDSPMHTNYVNQHSLFGAGQEFDRDSHKHSLSDDAPVVFDQSDSENDDHSEFDGFIKKDGFDSAVQHPEANFHVSSSNMDHLAPDQQKSGFNVKDGSSSSLRSVSRLQPTEFSGVARGDNPPSQSNAVVFDVSDEASSDSEDEVDEFTDKGDTVLNSLHDKKNMSKYEHQSSSRSSIGEETMDKVDQLSSSFTGADTESHPSYGGGHGLNFGRLTGGLRNKGYLHPPYVKNPMDGESLPSEASIDDSSRKSMASPKEKTAKFEDVNENVNNLKPHFKTIEDSRARSQSSFDSDSVGVEDLEPRPAIGSKGCRGVASLLSTTKLDDNLTMDNKEKVSSTFMKPESNEVNEEKPRQRSSRRASKESSHISAAAYISKDMERQSLSSTAHQYSIGDDSSILADQKPEDTKIVVSDTSKISGHASIYDKKSSVKTSKGSISTTTSFFDEENDQDEVLQPRDTVGPLGIRGGRRVSQRTRGSKVDRLSNFSGSSHGPSHDLKTPNLESKSFELTNSVSETPLNPLTSSVKSAKKRTSKFLPPNFSVEQHPRQLSETEVSVQKDSVPTHSASETAFKPSTSVAEPEKNKPSKFLPPNPVIEHHPAVLSEAEILAQEDGLESSQSSLSHDYLSQSASKQTGVPANNESVKESASVGGSTSRENSFKSSHVHPKLPDYETLADYFKTLRSNRR